MVEGVKRSTKISMKMVIQIMLHFSYWPTKSRPFQFKIT